VAFQVRDGDDDNLISQESVDDLIRKSVHQHTTGALIGRWSSDFGLRFTEVDSAYDGIKKLAA
jgi:hypothetical protein